jgi:hypothetical protein
MIREYHVRMCVQRRLACSVGVSLTGVTVRSPVVWIAGWRETKILKPIDKVSLGEIYEPPGRNDSERKFGLESEKVRGPSPHP